MNSWIKKTLWILLIILIIGLVVVFYFIQQSKMSYSGEKIIEPLQEEVEVFFDDYGIPHISSQNEADAYFALGYCQAGERLFQMEMLKRLNSGRLAEVLGPELLEVDKLFRTLGLHEKAKRSAVRFLKEADEELILAVQAYLDGVNYIVKNGNLPIEYRLLGLPRTEFEISDIYSVINFMSLGFSFATKEDAMIKYIHDNLGKEYLADLKLSSNPEYPKSIGDTILPLKDLSFGSIIDKELKEIGISQWHGSNAWVIGSEKTNNEKVLFANDTHMAFSQPAVWYEAHIKYPGFELYGHYLPLVPFAGLGHNEKLAWGLTIFPFDNVNYYLEKVDPENEINLMYNGSWEQMELRKEIIRVKGEEDVELIVRNSNHGPIVNDVDPNISRLTKDPVSLWWTVLQFESSTLEALYKMNNSIDLEAFANALPFLDVVGLYVNYGDVEGNVAWWATGKLPVFRDSLDGAMFLNGYNGKDEVLGYRDFKDNPQLINPDVNFIATANNDPEISGSFFVDGNYLPPDRINRIQGQLSKDDNWSIDKMKDLQVDDVSETKTTITKLMVNEIEESVHDNSFMQEALDLLKNWNGKYSTNSKVPIIYEKMLYHITKIAMADEMPMELMDMIYLSFLYERSINGFLLNDDSPWWDDKTSSLIEKRKDVFIKAFDITIMELKEDLGNDLANWTWGKRHQVTYEHSFGQKKLLAKIFNVGPFGLGGGNNVLNRMAYPMGPESTKKVTSGPTVRRLIDFSDPRHAFNASPTGQSGNPFSKYYDDQAEMFIEGKYREMTMDWEDIQKMNDLLLLKPGS